MVTLVYDYRNVISVLNEARVYNDSEPVAEAVKRLAGERDSERARYHAVAVQLLEEKKRGAQLEREILRLSAAPGASFVWRGTDKPPLPSEVRSVGEPEVADDQARLRLSRQRRELRRLNEKQRLFKLENEHLTRHVEDLTAALLGERRARRIAESINDAG